MIPHPQKSIFLLLFLFSLSGNSFTQNQTQTGNNYQKNENPARYISNPSSWISDCNNRLSELYLFHNELVIDTADVFGKCREHEALIAMLKDGFYNNRHSLNLRSVYNLKMRIANILDDITKWQHKVHVRNEILVKKTMEIEQIGFEIGEFRKKSDSIFIINFREEVEKLTSRQQNGENLIVAALKTNTAIENKIVDFKIQSFQFYTEISAHLQKQEESLIIRELPVLWQSPPSIYPYGLGDVLMASWKQTIGSVKYYSEISLWRIIIFRVVLFLFCLIPIGLFNHEQRKKHIISETNLKYLDKFPKSASMIMGMALAPLIFSHPPHAFLEFIFIGITFTVTMLTLKVHPKINKPLLLILMVSFMLLYLVNFFVTATFFGRTVFALSILLLIPLVKAHRQISKYEIENQQSVRFLLGFMIIHLMVGWVFVIWGSYTLGRSIVLAAYSVLVLSMILRVAIYTLLDYLEIIAFYFNRRFQTVQINTAFAYRKTKPLLIFFAFLFVIVAYLFNMNLFDLIVSMTKDFMLATRTIGTTEFSFLSITLLIASLYFSFVLASLIRHTFEPQDDHTSGIRSKLGSFLLLFRLLILLGGFIIGILISGFPLTNFAIFLGAMGVGIGFGLQNIVSNLVSGLIIAFERPFVVGDVLDLGNETAKVKEISLRATMVSTSDGADILIPNNTILSGNLKNWTITNKQRLLDLQVMTTQDANPAQVMEIIKQCLIRQNKINAEKSVVLFSDISHAGYLFTVRFMIHDLSNGLSIKSQVLSAIHAEFVAKGIRFPRKVFYTED